MFLARAQGGLPLAALIAQAEKPHDVAGENQERHDEDDADHERREAEETAEDQGPAAADDDEDEMGDHLETRRPIGAVKVDEVLRVGGHA